MDVGPIKSPIQLSGAQIMHEINNLFVAERYEDINHFEKTIRAVQKANPEHFEAYTKMIEARALTCRKFIRDAELTTIKADE